MAELADAHDSKSCEAIHAGSSPASGTIFILELFMNKVIIIGCPGSGKSTFARKLRDKTFLPLYYLDNIYHLPDKTDLSQEEFNKRIDEITRTDSWIIDGCYFNNIKDRIERCDTVFYFDLPPEICLKGARSRIGIKREDFPWIEEEGDEKFYNYILNFNSSFKDRIEKMLSEHKDKKIYIIKSHEEADSLAESIG